MNLFSISFKYLIRRPLDTLLNMLLLGMGVALVTALLIVGQQMDAQTEANLSGIDAVLGAKGSPLQLVLSSVFHADAPTGNISLEAAEKLAANPMVGRAIPLALGDSYRRYRIVGTTEAYPALYGAQIAEGKLWQRDFEAVIGADLVDELSLGDEFHGAHGLGEQAGEAHDHHHYRVVGILGRTGSVLDRLILTSIPSVWAMHQHDEHHGHDHQADTVALGKGLGLPMLPGQEVTAVLLSFKTPIAKMSLPRQINETSHLQAAQPTYELTRLQEFLGSGRVAITAFAYFMVGMALLGMFASLFKALKERRYDLALIRAMGGSRSQTLWLLLVESLYTAMGAWLLGAAIAHLGLELFLQAAPELSQLVQSGLVFYWEEGWIAGSALLIGLLAAILPAWSAYRTDVSEVLSQG